MLFRPEAQDLRNPIPEGIPQSGYAGMNATQRPEDYPPTCRAFFTRRTISGADIANGIQELLQPMQHRSLERVLHSMGGVSQAR